MSDDGRATTALDVRIGDRIRARRLEIGMSQEQLAALLGITFQQVQKYEKGVNRVAASRLHAIAAALEVSITHFFDGAARPKGTDATALEEAFRHPDVIELVKQYHSIESAKVRKRVLELVRAMASQ